MTAAAVVMASRQSTKDAQIEEPLNELASEDTASTDSWDEDFTGDEVYDSIDDKPCKVDDGLYIGSMLCEHQLEGLQALGITHVLQVAEGLSPSHADKLSYRTLHVADMPSEDLVAHFKKAFDFIAEAHSNGGGVLVHCVAGVSRSATVCCGWLMRTYGMSADEAFRRVHRARPWVMPNTGFRKQLERFEELGCDLSKWTAWRHFWKEEPLTLALMAIRRGSAGGASAGCQEPSGADGGGQSGSGSGCGSFYDFF